jgi:hypothetical protein
MDHRFGIIENPLKYEPRNWKRAGIFFASFTLAAIFRFRDGLPKPWLLVSVSVLGAVILTMSFLLWRPSSTDNPDPPPDSGAP